MLINCKFSRETFTISQFSANYNRSYKNDFNIIIKFDVHRPLRKYMPLNHYTRLSDYLFNVLWMEKEKQVVGVDRRIT